MSTVSAAQCVASPASNRIPVPLFIQFVVSFCCAGWAILTHLTATEELLNKWRENLILAGGVGSLQRRENWWSSKNSMTVVLPESDVWLSVWHLLVLEVGLRAAVVTTADTNRKRWLYWYIEVQSNLRALSLSFSCSEIAKCHSVEGARSHSVYMFICMHTQTLTRTLFLAQLIRLCGLRDKYRVCQNICIPVTRHLNMQSCHFQWTGWPYAAGSTNQWNHFRLVWKKFAWPHSWVFSDPHHTYKYTL